MLSHAHFANKRTIMRKLYKLLMIKRTLEMILRKRMRELKPNWTIKRMTEWGTTKVAMSDFTLIY